MLILMQLVRCTQISRFYSRIILQLFCRFMHCDAASIEHIAIVSNIQRRRSKLLSGPLLARSGLTPITWEAVLPLPSLERLLRLERRVLGGCFPLLAGVSGVFERL